jgi:hypothetical protein
VAEMNYRFLAGNDAHSMTGAELFVDGGMSQV